MICVSKEFISKKNKAEIWNEHLKEWFIPWVKDNLKTENKLVLKFYKKSYEIVILPKDCEDLKGNIKIFPLYKTNSVY